MGKNLTAGVGSVRVLPNVWVRFVWSCLLAKKIWIRVGFGSHILYFECGSICDMQIRSLNCQSTTGYLWVSKTEFTILGWEYISEKMITDLSVNICYFTTSTNRQEPSPESSNSVLFPSLTSCAEPPQYAPPLSFLCGRRSASRRRTFGASIASIFFPLF